MKKPVIGVLGIFLITCVAFAQAPKTATYITDEEIRTVNAQPGIDRTIRVVVIGNEHFAIGIIHRLASGAAARGASTGAGAGRGGGNPPAVGAGRGVAAPPERCGEQISTPPANGSPGGIAHDVQTEGYLIVSGGGTLVTGGRIVNGSKSAPGSTVTRELNGPSCSGIIVGDDVVKRVVKTGDIIIIPAGVPHGWTDITDHVDYLSFRPSGQVLEAGYVHPSIRK